MNAHFFHSLITGEEDMTTMTKMLEPRCGDSDVDDHDMSPSDPRGMRHKRWAIFQKWPKNDLTYRISTYTTKLPVDIVDDAVSRAFKVFICPQICMTFRLHRSSLRFLHSNCTDKYV